MAEESRNVTGQICWFEVPVTSVSRAAAFYSAVLGWECATVESGTPAPQSSVKSVHPFSRGILHGAFLLMPDSSSIAQVADASNPAKVGPLATFMVDSIDTALAKVEAEGGKCHVPKTAIGNDMGFFARFVDTEGNLQGLWSKN